MKYRHSHHAGNFADVLKHLTLVELLRSLAKKSTPYCYIDTHAGRGRYDLALDNPDAHSEFRAGFARLYGESSLPPAAANYVATIARLGSASTSADAPLSSYPGSPLIAAAHLRSEDRAVLFELSVHESDVLRDTVRPYHNVQVHVGDGYAGVRGQVPPRERRGLVLLDPAYEVQEQEFVTLLSTLCDAHARWPTGIYALWYPIKRRTAVARFHADLAASGMRKILAVELCLFPDDSRVSLNGSGMIVVNPPWQMDETLGESLPEIHRLLGGMRGSTVGCRWIVPE